MKGWSGLGFFLRGLFRPAETAREMDEELRGHVRERAEDLERDGLTRAKAERQARLEFGGYQKFKEECQEAYGRHFFENLAQDARFGLRALRRSPGFAAITVFVLALGIGANTAIFSLIDCVLIRPLPVQDPEQLTVLAFRQANGPLQTQFSWADLQDIRDATRGEFSDMLGYMIAYDGMSRNGKADRILTNYVTGNFFSTLGIKPYLGRFSIPPEGETLGADPAVVLSYDCWATRFGGDRSIIGQKILVNGHPITVIGVAPRGFHGLYPFQNVQAYLPFAMLTTYEAGWPNDILVNRILQNLQVLARLKPGIRLQNASAALSVVAQRLSSQYPDTDKGMMLNAYGERSARPDPGSARIVAEAAALFLALVALVLLLACVNVANILLVRATVRAREMAIRSALGAGRGRLVRQLLTESILLAIAGGMAGMLLGEWGSRAIGSVDLHMFMPVNLDLGFDWRIFAYAFAAALATGILAGVAPALRASRSEVSDVLHETSRSVTAGSGGLRAALVVLQVAGSLMLLVIAALFTESLSKVQRTDLGFDPHNVVNLTMDPSEVGYDKAQGLAFYQTLLERVRALPGIESAALTSSTPLGDYSNNDYLKISGYQSPSGGGLPLVPYSVVSVGFFDTMRTPLLRGRDFSEADAKDSPYVAIVNQAFAARYWPGRNPIGQHFAKVSGPTNPAYEVIGVVKNSRFAGLTGAIDPYFYLPLAQDYELSSTQVLQVRSAAPPDAVIREAENIVSTFAPELPVFNVETMSASLDTISSFLLFQFGAAPAACLGLLGLILAMVGVYGVISYSVSQRTHEIGIRVALGAQPRQILKLILGQGVLIVCAGVMAGCAGALVAARLISNFLVGVSPQEPLAYAGVSLILASVALVACYVPARRAMNVDPMQALRHE